MRKTRGSLARQCAPRAWLVSVTAAQQEETCRPLESEGTWPTSGFKLPGSQHQAEYLTRSERVPLMATNSPFRQQVCRRLMATA